MSAIGTKRTSMLTLSMSAFRGKADIPATVQLMPIPEVIRTPN